MSRIGKAPVVIQEGVTVSQSGKTLVVKGPKGELTVHIPSDIKIHVAEGKMVFEGRSASKQTRARHGLMRAIVANNIVGVTRGWSKTLELSGVGYRASMNGNNLVLTIGFSHPVTVHPKEGITFEVIEGKIVIRGIDKHLVGQVAAEVRAIKKPEPYKGKGIHYVGEHIRKKAGKAAKAIGGAPGAGGGK